MLPIAPSTRRKPAVSVQERDEDTYRILVLKRERQSCAGKSHQTYGLLPRGNYLTRRLKAAKVIARFGKDIKIVNDNAPYMAAVRTWIRPRNIWRRKR
jgi:hypothetical protein